MHWVTNTNVRYCCCGWSTLSLGGARGEGRRRLLKEIALLPPISNATIGSTSTTNVLLSSLASAKGISQSCHRFRSDDAAGGGTGSRGGGVFNSLEALLTEEDIVWCDNLKQNGYAIVNNAIDPTDSRVLKEEISSLFEKGLLVNNATHFVNKVHFFTMFTLSEWWSRH